MGLLGAIFGHTKIRKPDREKFFSIITAAYSLQGRTDLRPMDKAGLVFNPVESTYFDNLDREIKDLLRISGRDSGTRFEVTDDEFGTRWVVLDDPDFEDLVSTIHGVAETINEHGFGDRLLAAVFKFEYDRQEAYWIYNYKSGRFYPFVQSGVTQRDNNFELRLGEIMKSEKIPVERDLEKWYSLWGIPF